MSKKKAASIPERPLFEAVSPMLIVPFAGKPCPFRLRKLSGLQVAACGDFSLIETFQDKIARKKTPTTLELNEYAERQHQICKLSMVQPTYEEVMAEIAPGADWKGIESELQAIKREFDRMVDGPEKKELQDRYNRIELRHKFILPEDFLGAVLDFALSITESGIKSVSDKMLIDAATLAVLGHDNPHDHVDTSLLKPHHIVDFDNRAWIEYYREQEKKKKRA